MRILLISSLLFFQLKVNAQTDQRWRWYLSSFCSPKFEANLCTRAGLAQVNIRNGRIHAVLMDPKLPEANLAFEGPFSKQRVIKGQLQGLSSHTPSQDKYQGHYRSLQLDKNCETEQIILLPEVPDGSVISLSRVLGSCQ